MTRLRWYHVAVAVALLILLYGLNLSSDSPSLSDKVANWWSVTPPPPDETGRFNFDKWFFQAEITVFRLPEFNTAALSTHQPRNWKGPGHETIATYYASRNATMQDPYFFAAQQIVYRVLWDPRSRSQHTMTVFVAPYVPQAQRDYFTAAGAIVRELDLVPFEPNEETSGRVAGRLMDMFSKLEMWKQTDFSRILYLDSDAFPMANVDHLFTGEMAPELTCDWDLLSPDDQIAGEDMCTYVFAGHVEELGDVNAGVIVFKPNEALYNTLIRESKHQENYDNGFVEQAFLSYFYRRDGPFPPSTLSDAYNAFTNFYTLGKEVFILHGKIWALWWVPAEKYVSDLFNNTWLDMLELYESPRFAELRLEDDGVK